MMKRFLAALALASTLIHSGGNVLAATWINPAGGVFDVPSNWTGGTVPGAGDVAEFSFVGPLTVDFTTTPTTASLDVIASDVTFNLMGNDYTVTGLLTIEESIFAFGMPARLEVLGGNLLAGNARVGGSIFGNAELIIGAGGRVDAVGQLEVGGSNNANESSITVSAGGLLVAQQLAFIGGTTGQNFASGIVNVSGTGTQFVTLSFVTVGGAGTGVLNIDDGASLFSLPLNVPDTTATGVIANEAGSTGIVNVSLGATWTDSQGINVGRAGSGALNILSAGLVDSPTSTVARLPGSTGSVTIDGANSRWMVTGDLTIGGTATAGGGIGTVDVTNAGRLETNADIRVRSGSQLGGDGVIQAEVVNIDAGARLSGTPTINALTVSNSGTVAPGFSPGIMTILGDFTQNSEGVLEIEVEGLVPGIEHDQLQISGNAILAGRLDVPVTSGPGFPQLNDEITFIQTAGPGGVMGQFATVTSPNLPTAAPGLAVRVNYLPNEVRLQFVAPTVNNFVGSGGSWFTSGLWSSGGVPTSADRVHLNNSNLGMSATVSIDGANNAGVHDIEISGVSQPMTLSVGVNNTLFANSGVEISNNGVLDLTEGGTVTSPCVQVNAGGLLKGVGTLNGNTVVGSLAGAAAATLSPGNSTGVLNQNGNLRIMSNGVVEIELVDDKASVGGPNNDMINISGEATFGGTLVLDATGYDPTPPTTSLLPSFDIITAGSRAAGSEFDEVVMTNFPANLGFDTIYSESGVLPVVAGGPGTANLAAASNGSGTVVTVVGSFLGDMNWDGELDPEEDVPAFVLGLTDPFQYFQDIMDINGDSHPPMVLGDVDDGKGGGPDGKLDFDDVDAFARRFDSLSALMLFEMIDDALAEIAANGGATSQYAAPRVAASHAANPLACGIIPEPSTLWLLLIGGILLKPYTTRHGFGTTGRVG